MVLSIRGSEVKALRTGMDDDCTGSVLVHESYFNEGHGRAMTSGPATLTGGNAASSPMSTHLNHG